MSRPKPKASANSAKTLEASTPIKTPSKHKLPESAKSHEFARPALTPSEALDSEIKSKQRTLALLDRRLEGDAALHEQILARDRRLDELNARLVASEAKSKVKKDTTSAKLKEQIAKLTHELQSSLIAKTKNEEAIATLRTELAEWKARAEDEKEAGELLSEALMEETEAAKAELEQKKGQVGEVKKDIIQLSKIIQDMTKLNAELNAKIDVINRDTARMSTDYYAAVAKAEHTEQLEKDLAEYINSSQRYEKQVGKLTEVLEKSHKSKLAIESTSREVQATLQHLTGMLGDITNLTSQDPRITGIAAQMSEGLKSARHKLKQVTPDEVSRLTVEADEPALNAQLREARLQLKEKERLSARDQVEMGNLLRKLSRIEAQHSKELAESNDATERSQRRSNILLEQVNGFSERLDQLRNELGKKEADLQKAQTQVLNLQNRVEDTKRKLKDHSEKSSALEKLMKEQRASILKTQTERFEEEKLIALKEKKVLKAMSNLKSWQEELYFKDTELIRKTKELNSLTQQLTDSDAKCKALQAKLKSASSEGAEEYVKLVEDKNREIEILKEMVRGARVSKPT